LRNEAVNAALMAPKQSIAHQLSRYVPDNAILYLYEPKNADQRTHYSCKLSFCPLSHVSRPLAVRQHTSPYNFLYQPSQLLLPLLILKIGILS
jgi:hypothetical protein